MSETSRVVLVGAGVIGAGWAARLVINGFDVVVCDPDPEAERKVREVLDNALAAYRRLTLAPLEAKGRLCFEPEIEKAVPGADFIQESSPENEALKSEILRRIDAAAKPEAVIGSSTSGLLPTRLQAAMQHPERFVVGHPFNPVYLMPLVEICGGEKTSEETRQAAAAFYRSIGMHPLMVRKEIDGFIADRLMEALWREALWLVEDGIATTGEIDDAVRFGPGLRWAFMGTFLTYRLAGGEAGMRHFMEQFGPALKLPWTKLEAPELTEELIEKVVAQSDDQAEGVSIRELERLRDDCLISVMQGLRNHGYGAGAVLKDYEEKLYADSHALILKPGDDVSKPLRLHEATVETEWVDYNGHMTESRYLQVFGDASDALFRFVGIDADYHAAGYSYYTVETHIMNLREVAGGEPLYVTTEILGLDEKRMQIFHTLYHGREDTRLATAEQMLLHVDTKEGRACPAQPQILDNLRRIFEAQAELPEPEHAGRRIAMPEKKPAAAG